MGSRGDVGERIDRRRVNVRALFTVRHPGEKKITRQQEK